MWKNIVEPAGHRHHSGACALRVGYLKLDDDVNNNSNNIYIYIYIFTAIGLSPGGSVPYTHL